MLKVSLISPLPPPSGGIAQWTLFVLKGIVDNESIALNHINTAQSQRHLAENTIVNRIVSGFGVLGRVLPGLLSSLFRGVDVIHLTTSGHLGLMRDIVVLILARLFNCPVVYHLHYGRIVEISLLNKWEWLFQKICINLSHTVITLDVNTENCIRQFVRKGPLIRCIPNPIDVAAAEEEALLCNTDRPIIGRFCFYLGWVIQTKGIEDLLEAWKQTAHANISLVIAGPSDPSYLMKLKESIPDKSVVFLGEVEHSRAMGFLSQSEFLILPSYSEGFPNVVLEAMALRRGVLATAVGAIPEMLSGGCGVVVESRNVPSLRQGLNDFIHHPELARAYGINGFNKCLREYDIRSVVNRYVEVWISTCDKK